jgi:tetratricopeptide (TPR) repeat protein
LAFAALVAQALHPATTVTLFLFWFGLAAAMTSWRLTFPNVFASYEADLRGRRDSMLVAQALALAVIAGVGIGGIATARAYSADMAYHEYRQTGSRAALERAADYNPQRAQYHTARAREYMSTIADDVAILSTPGGVDRISAERRETVRETVGAAVSAGEAATTAAPNGVAAWETAAALYRDIRLIAVGSTEPALQAFKRAQELEPTNPIFAVEIGKLHLDRGETGEAVAAFERAIALKPEYVEARRGLAKAYDALGQTDKALVVLEEAIRSRQTPELLYEAGRMYYNQDRFDEAIARFNEALALRPGYANAMYSLGLAYQQRGDAAAALEQFRGVLVMNPDNEAVRDLVESLE